MVMKVAKSSVTLSQLFLGHLYGHCAMWNIKKRVMMITVKMVSKPSRESRYHHKDHYCRRQHQLVADLHELIVELVMSVVHVQKGDGRPPLFVALVGVDQRHLFYVDVETRFESLPL